MSERDGWRHLYVVSRDGRSTKLLTPGDFDIHNPASLFGEHEVLGVDERAGLVYFTASPTNATQFYLYSARLDGAGTMRRVTPASASGTHGYVISHSGPIVPAALATKNRAKGMCATPAIIGTAMRTTPTK